jgi:hypothetical protein
MDTYFYGNNTGTARLKVDAILEKSIRFDVDTLYAEMSVMQPIFEEVANRLNKLFDKHDNIFVSLGKYGVLIENSYQTYLISASNKKLDFINNHSEFLDIVIVPVLDSVEQYYYGLNYKVGSESNLEKPTELVSEQLVSNVLKDTSDKQNVNIEPVVELVEVESVEIQDSDNPVVLDADMLSLLQEKLSGLKVEEDKLYTLNNKVT